MRRFAVLLFLIFVARARDAEAEVDAHAPDTWQGGPDAPPWIESDDIPLPESAHSVITRTPEAAIYEDPGRFDLRRGTVPLGAHLPLFGAKRSDGCSGRWLLVGPLAWVCSDAVDFSPDDPHRERASARGRPAVRYFFVGEDGASGFYNLDDASSDSPDIGLEPGFGFAVVAEREIRGERWLLTRRGTWIAARELVEARPLVFHGEEVRPQSVASPSTTHLDFGWVVADRAMVFGAPKEGKPRTALARLARVSVYQENAGFVRVSPDGATPVEWMRTRDLALPTIAPPPAELKNARAGERWIDVDLATQTLVAWEGSRPVYATLVSTGRGGSNSDTATPIGVHRIWAKLQWAKMGNLGEEDPERRYLIDDVPDVQFFDQGIALHGAFWHSNFGHVQSHGCVNMTPQDAHWLFEWTAPHLPAHWSAVLPTHVEPGTLVRVR